MTSAPGRILNAVWGGYAVGVAGLVGFIPAKQCARPTARRIGQLQKFRILEVSWAVQRGFHCCAGLYMYIRAGQLQKFRILEVRWVVQRIFNFLCTSAHRPAVPHPGGALALI